MGIVFKFPIPCQQYCWGIGVYGGIACEVNSRHQEELSEYVGQAVLKVPLINIFLRYSGVDPVSKISKSIPEKLKATCTAPLIACRSTFRTNHGAVLEIDSNLHANVM